MDETDDLKRVADTNWSSWVACLPEVQPTFFDFFPASYHMITQMISVGAHW